MAHTAARIGYVASAPGDQMDVAVEDGLPGNLPSVHAYVESLHGRVLLHDARTQLMQQLGAGGNLVSMQAEEVHDMSLGDHEAVPLGHRKSVEYREGEFVLKDNPACR
jgi:hypothetical protein